MNRGDIVICTLHKDLGKARPAIVIQSDLFNATHNTTVVCPLTTHLVDASLFRLSLEPSKQHGVLQASQIMIDKMSAIKKERIKNTVGKLTKSELETLNHAIKMWLHL